MARQRDILGPRTNFRPKYQFKCDSFAPPVWAELKRLAVELELTHRQVLQIGILAVRDLLASGQRAGLTARQEEAHGMEWKPPVPQA